MAEPAVHVGTSLADFLAWEERQPERWERVAGVVRMMAGGTADRNLIATNLLAALRSRLAGRACRAFVNDLEVTAPRGESTYPDVVLVCPPPPGGRRSSRPRASSPRCSRRARRATTRAAGAGSTTRSRR